MKACTVCARLYCEPECAYVYNMWASVNKCVCVWVCISYVPACDLLFKTHSCACAFFGTSAGNTRKTYFDVSILKRFSCVVLLVFTDFLPRWHFFSPTNTCVILIAFSFKRCTSCTIAQELFGVSNSTTRRHYLYLIEWHAHKYFSVMPRNGCILLIKCPAKKIVKTT